MPERNVTNKTFIARLDAMGNYYILGTMPMVESDSKFELNMAQPHGFLHFL